VAGCFERAKQWPALIKRIVGSAAALPLAAGAQQPMPMIGLLKKVRK